MLQEPSNSTQGGGHQDTLPGNLLPPRCAQHPLHCGRKEGDLSPESEGSLPAVSLTDTVCPHHLSLSPGSCYLLSPLAEAAGKPPREILH